jgi:integrase
MATIIERKNKQGKSVYRAQVRVKGHPSVSASFSRKTDARNWAQQTEASIKEGKFFNSCETQKHTLGELIDRYIANILPLKPRSVEKQGMQLLWWKKCLGKYLLKDITPAVIINYRDLLAGGVTYRHRKRSTATVNRYMAALSHALSIAYKEWGWLESNPCMKISKLKERQGRVRYLSDEERKALLQCAKGSSNPHLYTIIVIALSTGMRYSELLKMEWEQVNFKLSFITLYATKNGEIRNVPIAGHALELLHQHYLNKKKRASCFSK